MKSIQKFINVIGDKLLEQITLRNMFVFRGWRLERIAAGEALERSNADYMPVARKGT